MDIMKRKDIINNILVKLQEAEEKHPTFPVDTIHQVSIMNEEAGEAIRAALQYVYEKGSIKALELELMQTAAMCIRVLENLQRSNTEDALDWWESLDKEHKKHLVHLHCDVNIEDLTDELIRGIYRVNIL
jgi:hypothetical protein